MDNKLIEKIRLIIFLKDFKHQEICNLLDISRSTLHRVLTGKTPIEKIETETYFKLLNFIESHGLNTDNENTPKD